MWKRIVDAWNGNATSPSTPGVNTYDFEGMKKLLCNMIQALS